MRSQSNTLIRPAFSSASSSASSSVSTDVSGQSLAGVSARGIVAAVALVSLLSGCSLFGPKPAWEEPPPPPAERAIVAAADLTRTKLANGIEILVLEDHRLPRASIGLTLRRGAGSVPPEHAGLAELVTEVMQRGAGEHDALALARIVEDAGASLSVSAGWDTTGISMSGLSSDRALLFSILEDVALRPRFDAMEFEKARSEQIAGIQGAVDDPATLVKWHTLKVLYPGHRYGLPISGTAETLGQLTASTARRYWTDRLVPSSMIFWAVGDLDAEEVVTEVRARFGSLPESAEVAKTPAVPEKTP